MAAMFLKLYVESILDLKRKEAIMLRIERSKDPTIITGEDVTASTGSESRSECRNSGDIYDILLQGGERFPQIKLQLKGCMRCGGDVTSGRDWDGNYVKCLQCGWYKDAPGDAVSEIVETTISRLMDEMEQSRAR